MRRVLSSGYVKLLRIGGPNVLNNVMFKFEIKAPVLLLLKTFQEANLGHIRAFVTPDTSEAFIPPSFHKEDPSGFISIGDKDCNELYTKYSNYYINSVNFYYKLLKNGVCQEEAQLILPQGLLTTFTWDINAIELATFIEKYKDVSPEVYGYCEVFMLYLQENLLNEK